VFQEDIRLNPVAVLILTVIIAEFIVTAIADRLNLRGLSQPLPPILSDIYDADQYRKSQHYLTVNTYFDWVNSGVSLAVTLLFWFGKGFTILDAGLREMNQGPILTGLLFIGTLALLKSLVDLPFSIYHTFVIEEKFGFNKTTVRTFILDRLKGLGLALLLGIPLLTGILAFLEYCGHNAWLYCWGVVVVFMLILQFVAPTWIMPLFNKFTPIEPGELKTAILSYAQRIGFSLENVFVMDGSKRSSKSNAFFTGFGRHRRIVLFDTLINHTGAGELVAVLAHEMGHYKKHHILLSLLIGIAHTGVLFFLLSLFLSYQGLFDAFYVSEMSVYAGLIFFSMLYTPIELFMGILMQLLSRKNEYAADRFAAETTHDPEALISALKKLAAENLSNLTPHPFYVFLTYSHPPLMDRLQALAAHSKTEG
jgi:STE24 endopeptidase